MYLGLSLSYYREMGLSPRQMTSPHTTLGDRMSYFPPPRHPFPISLLPRPQGVMEGQMSPKGKALCSPTKDSPTDIEVHSKMLCHWYV